MASRATLDAHLCRRDMLVPLVLKKLTSLNGTLLHGLPDATPIIAKAFTEKQKKDYYASLGEGPAPAAQLVGFDAALAGASLRTSQDAPVTRL